MSKKKRSAVTVPTDQKIQFRSMARKETVTESNVLGYSVESEFTCATVGVCRTDAGSATPYEVVCQTYPGPACELPPGTDKMSLANSWVTPLADLSDATRKVDQALNCVMEAIQSSLDQIGNDGEEWEIAVTPCRGILRPSQSNRPDHFPIQGGFRA